MNGEIAINEEFEMQGSKLYFGNLTYSVTNHEIEELCANYGDVKNVNIIQGKGFGFVEMGSNEEAEKVKEELNGTDFAGRTLRIDEARPPRPRDDRRGGGGYGGGNY